MSIMATLMLFIQLSPQDKIPFNLSRVLHFNKPQEKASTCFQSIRCAPDPYNILIVYSIY